MSRLSHFSLLASTVCLLTAASPSVAALNSQEQALADRIIDDGGQGRPFVTIDATLSAVARAKAADMARREYFAHTDPDGHGANYLVRRAGYALPGHYAAAENGNNIESLAAGYSSVSSVWTGWMNSADHKRHILGQTSFFAEQTALGVGYYEESGTPYRFYWVVLTAPPATPRLTISSPAANATLTSSDVTLTGATSGGPAADRVEVRVENANGNGGYVLATGRVTWSATVGGLAAGSNTLRVRSRGAGGSVILEATRTVRFVVLEPLNVSISGGGVVTKGFAGASQREVGREYVIAAAPAAGWLFSHWSGGYSANTPRLTFRMREGLGLTANFIPNPFLARKGAYTGLLAGSSAEHATSGLVKITVANTGAITGQVLLGGAVHAFTGRLDADGDATITLARSGRAPLTLRLDLDAEGSSERLSGTLSDGSFAASFDADRAWQPGSAPSAFAGRYTISLPASGSFGTPEGAGWAVLSVSTSGVAALSGKLADGAAISAGATVSRDGLLPIFRALYAGLGSISGSLRFRATSGSDLDGSCHWHMPERPAPARYRAAFSVENSIVGSRYAAPPSGQRVIALATVAGNAVVTLAGGDLDPGFAQSVTVSTVNGVRPVAPVVRGFTAAITAANGFFSGAFTDSGNVARRFEGVFLQKQNAGFGFFLGAQRSGMVEFAPSP